MPGYLKPAHFLTYLEFVRDEGYKKESFQRYLLAKFRAIHDKGGDPFRLDKLTRPQILGANAMRRLMLFVFAALFASDALPPRPTRSGSAATACITRTGSSRVSST